MISLIRRRFTYANVAMTLALVFAMTGGAYAAKHYLITSTKQISPKVLKQLKGKRGPAGSEGKQGPQGPQGPQGVKGDAGATGEKGAKGDTGAAGTNGKSVVVGTEAKGSANCANGGVSVSVEGSTAKKYVCNGGFGEEMETGAILRGNWSIATSRGISYGMASVSYLAKYPGETPPTIVLVRSGASAECSTVTEPVKAYCESENQAASEHCHGTGEEPQADPGFVCFYVNNELPNLGANFVTLPGESTLYGASLKEAAGELGGALALNGTWAVTTPAAG